MEELEIQAERVKAAGALGRSPVVLRLFDFLLERSTDTTAPKETEVAEAVFGRTGGFDISQDSTVRVYVHRLRGKLDDYYRGPGRGETLRLAIPKGEYRIVVLPAEDLPPVSTGIHLPKWVWPVVGILVALNVVVGGALWWKHFESGFAYAHHTPAWRGLLHDEDRPITLVVGDYYIFGEADEHAEVVRLVRRYEINSPDDLADMMMADPSLMGKYVDLDLHYLPTSIATAMRSLMPMLASNPRQRERIRVVSASALTPEMLKRNNIIYIGYLSGLGILREPVFAGSRFRIGDTYDVLVDQQTKKEYVSHEGGPDAPSETRSDYGYFSTFTGPNGNRIAIVAGTRDVAVMQTAEALSTREGLAALSRQTKKNESFEALYEVEAMNRVNMQGRLVLVSPLKTGKIWDDKTPAPVFPKN